METYNARKRKVQGVSQGKAHTEMLDVREVPRDVAQERAPRHVLSELGCDHDRHGGHARSR